MVGKGCKLVLVGEGEGMQRIFFVYVGKVQVSRDKEAHDKVDNLLIIRVLNWSEFIYNLSLLTLKL